MVTPKKPPKPEKKSLLQNLEGASKEEKLQTLYNDWHKCRRCPLVDFRCTDEGQPIEDIVFCSGNPNASIMIVGEAPGEEEMEMMVPFVGRSGKLLNQILAATSQDAEIKQLYAWYLKVSHTNANEKTFHSKMFEWRDREYFLTNIVACRPPENRAPLPPEMEACKTRLDNLIYTVDPLLIISAGGIAASALTGHKILITSRRGEIFDTPIKGKLVDVLYPTLVTLHPSYLLRKADWNVAGGDYSKTVGDYAHAQRLVKFLQEQHRGVG